MTAAYDGFAEIYETHAATSPYNAHYDRPAVLDLCGDVGGKQILDAGCGPGLVASELLSRGAARLVAVDQSQDMVDLARRRLGERATVRRHDLDEPLSWLPAGSVDVVVSSLVLHYVTDRVATLRELSRVLAPGGRLVFSTGHPTGDWLYMTRLGYDDDYFTPRWVEDTWRCGLTVRWWHQPLDHWFDEIRQAGLVVERFLETRPAPSMAAAHPDDFETLTRRPGFVAFRLAAA